MKIPCTFFTRTAIFLFCLQIKIQKQKYKIISRKNMHRFVASVVKFHELTPSHVPGYTLELSLVTINLWLTVPKSLTDRIIVSIPRRIFNGQIKEANMNMESGLTKTRKLCIGLLHP